MNNTKKHSGDLAEQLTRIHYDSQIDSFTPVLLIGFIMGISLIVFGIFGLM